jgi:hypothetical protein
VPRLRQRRSELAQAALIAGAPAGWSGLRQHGGTNFDPAVDMHAHEGTFHVKDADTVGSSFVTWAGGKPQPMLEGVMVRKTAG